MGRQRRNRTVIILLSLLLASCGEFIGFEELKPDLGDLPEFRTFLGEDDVAILNDSVSISQYASSRFEGGDAHPDLDWAGDAGIRIRGYTSRMVPKKNFTLLPDTDGDEVKYAIDAGNPWINYNLAMYAYTLIDLSVPLPAPQLQPVGHYMNGEYLGYYNIIRLYDETLDEIYGEDGELYKIRFHDPGNAIPAEEDCEKKYPDDDDYSSLNTLLVYSEHLETSEWVPWIEANVDLESVAAYMAVRDFFSIADTSFTNFYIYAGDKYRILPWDNDRMFDQEGGVGGNNVLTRRMLESDVCKQYYIDIMSDCFLAGGSGLYQDIIGDIQDRKDELELLLEPAAHADVFYMDYSSYLEEMSFIDDFLTTRPGIIQADSTWQALNS